MLPCCQWVIRSSATNYAKEQKADPYDEMIRNAYLSQLVKDHQERFDPKPSLDHDTKNKLGLVEKNKMETRIKHLEDSVQFMEKVLAETGKVLAENLKTISEITSEITEMTTQLEDISQMTAQIAKITTKIHLDEITAQTTQLKEMENQIANLSEKLDPEFLKRELWADQE